MLYEAISGKPAFAAASQASLIAAILKEEPAALSEIQPLMPAALYRVVRKCMAKDPDARWKSAADLCDELRWISQAPAESVAAAAAPARRMIAKWIPAAVALAIGIAAGVFWQSSRTSVPAVWSGIRLGGPSTAFCPRISPDGQMLAFLTLVNGLSQVAVMKADGSSWTLLTSQKDSGYAADLAWAPRRIQDLLLAVLRPAARSLLCAGPRRRASNDQGERRGRTLLDGSLTVASAANQGYYQLERFWPETGREDRLPSSSIRSSFPRQPRFPTAKRSRSSACTAPLANRPVLPACTR